jgi:hypothetical protein
VVKDKEEALMQHDILKLEVGVDFQWIFASLATYILV